MENILSWIENSCYMTAAYLGFNLNFINLAYVLSTFYKLLRSYAYVNEYTKIFILCQFMIILKFCWTRPTIYNILNWRLILINNFICMILRMKFKLLHNYLKMFLIGLIYLDSFLINIFMVIKLFELPNDVHFRTINN